MKRFFKALVATGNPKALWQRYVVAVALIAALLTTTHIAASMALQVSGANADLINTSGRQRMLSQRVMFLSLQAADHNEQGVVDNLRASIELLTTSQKRLAQEPRLSADLVALYEAPGDLNARVQRFAALANGVAAQTSDSPQYLEELLVFDHALLLKDLDAAVSGFEALSEADSKRLELVQTLSFYAAIFILIIEGILIFVPAQLTVTKSIDRLEKQKRVVNKAKVDAVRRNRELEVLKNKVEHEALHDALTGLPNRRALELSMQKVKSLAEQRDAVVSVMHIDLDRFKMINDTLGHAAGDFVLQHVAHILKKCASEKDLVARVGGDEFVILAELNASKSELGARAESIISSMRKPIPYKDTICHFGASIGIGIGISSQQSTMVDPSELLVKADIALYRAKELGKGRFEFFSEELAADVEMTKRTSDDLLLALQNDDFTVHYQPIFDARSGELVSVEALARWQHPQLGLLSAGQFIKQVESLGLMAELDAIVLSKIERDLSTAQRLGAPLPRIAINVSARSLLEGDFIERILASRLPAHGLALEVSETVDFDGEIGLIMTRLAEVKAHGVDVEIDDFGTGHASLFSFRKLAPDRIKIARELVADVVTSANTRQMVHGICHLAKALGTETVAEGVETELMQDTLRLLGCNYLQGFGLSKPKSFDTLLEELSQNRQAVERSVA